MTGKVDAIIANNPYGYADYIADAAQLLKKDGTLRLGDQNQIGILIRY